jgi:hypothetical protein
MGARRAALVVNDGRDERGFVTVQYVAATALSLVFLLLVANLLVNLYARGVVREALDEGVRAAAPVDARASACEARAAAVLDGLLRGPIGDGVAVTCAVGPERARATAVVTLPSWLPGVPPWRFTVEAGTRRDG